MFRALQPSEAPGSGDVLASLASAGQRLWARGRGEVCGQWMRIGLNGHVTVHGLDGEVTVYASRAVNEGWSTIAGYRERLWREALAVERRDLAVCEEAARWN